MIGDCPTPDAPAIGTNPDKIGREEGASFQSRLDRTTKWASQCAKVGPRAAWENPAGRESSRRPRERSRHERRPQASRGSGQPNTGELPWSQNQRRARCRWLPQR